MVKCKQTKIKRKRKSRKNKKAKELEDNEVTPNESESEDNEDESSFDDTGCKLSENQKRYKVDENKEMITVEGLKETVTNLISEADRQENLQILDIRTVLGMLQQISTKIDENKTQSPDCKQIEEMKQEIKRNLEADFNKAMENQDAVIANLKQELADFKNKSMLYENIMHYHADVINDMSKRLDALELTNAKKSAILTGLHTDRKKADCKQQIQNFFQQKLKTTAEIDDVYHLNNKDPAPVVIAFSSIAEKDRIFQLKSALKEIKETDGTIYYLNHYIHTTENEKRKRERVIINENKKKQGTEKVEIEYVKGAMCINSTPYRKLVSPPKPTDLLDLSVEELDNILKLPTLRGPEITKNGNSFIGYSIDTDRIQPVRSAYHKIRLLHARARHVVCAFNLPSSSQETHLYQDSCDDEEAGAGSFLLQEMKKSRISHKAFFVVRYCSKEKLKEERLNCYLHAAKCLLAQKPVNGITKETQVFSPSKTPVNEKQQKPPVPKGNHRQQNPRGRLSSTRGSYANAVSP